MRSNNFPFFSNYLLTLRQSSTETTCYPNMRIWPKPKQNKTKVKDKDSKSFEPFYWTPESHLIAVFLCFGGNRLRANSLITSQLRIYYTLNSHKVVFLPTSFSKDMIQKCWRPQRLICNHFSFHSFLLFVSYFYFIKFMQSLNSR